MTLEFVKAVILSLMFYLESAPMVDKRHILNLLEGVLDLLKKL